jgi:hypothetical protein
MERKCEIQHKQVQVVGIFVSVGGKLWKQFFRNVGKWVEMLLRDDALGLLEYPTGSPHMYISL